MAPLAYPRVQDNTAEIFGRDVYLDSWVATTVYMSPYPTPADVWPDTAVQSIELMARVSLGWPGQPLASQQPLLASPAAAACLQPPGAQPLLAGCLLAGSACLSCPLLPVPGMCASALPGPSPAS